MLDGKISKRVIFHIFWPNNPVKKWYKTIVYSPYVTPNCPTLVLRIPVWCYDQFAVQKANWVLINMRKISSFYILVAWHIPNIKNVKEKESHPWSKSCPSGELLFVLLACLPSIASNVE